MDIAAVYKSHRSLDSLSLSLLLYPLAIPLVLYCGNHTRGIWVSLSVELSERSETVAEWPQAYICQQEYTRLRENGHGIN